VGVCALGRCSSGNQDVVMTKADGSQSIHGSVYDWRGALGDMSIRLAPVFVEQTSR
jgi:hypothetical protein